MNFNIRNRVSEKLREMKNSASWSFCIEMLQDVVSHVAYVAGMLELLHLKRKIRILSEKHRALREKNLDLLSQFNDLTTQGRISGGHGDKANRKNDPQ